MQKQTVHIVSSTIRYIEDNLEYDLNLDIVAEALHYSKFYLHRMFTQTVGFTIHDYVRRRKITEAARLLVFSRRPIIEIAFLSGYDSQQAFTDIFKAMYKVSPAEFREAEDFYPLQLKICLNERIRKKNFTTDDIRPALPVDITDWMKLVRLAIDGYPHLNEAEYLENLSRYIMSGEALILKDRNLAVGALIFSADTGNIEFLAVHPQYRKQGIPRLFLDKLKSEQLCGKEVSITTYRAGDKADTGYREEYRRLGFAEKELLTEFGYPTQRFVLFMENEEKSDDI